MSQQESNSRKYNIVVFIIFAIFIFIIIMLRVFQLVIAQESNGVNLAEINPTYNYGSSTTQMRRGSLYDQYGQPIAMDTTSYSIHAVINSDRGEEEVEDIDHTATRLTEYIDLSRDEILDILTTSDVNQVEFGQAGKGLSVDTVNALMEEDLPGIEFTSETERVYTNDYFASHLIGYATPTTSPDGQLRGQIMKGELGIELAFNDYLNGTTVEDASINELNVGNDLYLTIDSRLQNYLEDLMTTIYQKYQPEEMGAYLVEVETGRLLSASQRPTFNLNSREGIEEEWRNLLVENSYEPGSTIKILTMGVANDLNLYDPNETFRSGSVQVYDQIVSDYNKTGWGDITFDEGLARSSNVAMVKLVERMGIETWVDKLASFGFGQSTESGLPNETSGSINFDNPVSAIMSSFGQGLLTSPIQLLQAYTTIGNEGNMMKIQYIDQMKGTNNYSFEPIEIAQPIQAESANHVLDVLVDTVEAPYGTAQDFKHDTVPIAAKTGTAQVANPEGTGYLTGPNDYYFSVISFFPAEDPQYMLYLSLKRPQNNQGRTGSQILAELFHPFVDYIMINE